MDWLCVDQYNNTEIQMVQKCEEFGHKEMKGLVSFGFKVIFINLFTHLARATVLMSLVGFALGYMSALFS